MLTLINNSEASLHLIKCVFEYLDEGVTVLLTVGVLEGHESGHQGLQVDPPELHVPLQGGGTQT